MRNAVVFGLGPSLAEGRTRAGKIEMSKDCGAPWELWFAVFYMQ